MVVSQIQTGAEESLKLQFYGGVGTVTGSRTLVKSRGRKILIDCGLFQGYKNLRQLNWVPFPFDPRELDAVILTHAHLDHSGALPLLVKQGFSGPIFASESTVAVAGILLPDSAKLQEEEAEYANRHKTSKHSPALPLYTSRDVERTMELFMPLSFDKQYELTQGMQVTLTRAGHILGASSIHLEIDGKKIVFSGDLGRYGAPIMFDPSSLGEADYVIMESTYGDREHHNEAPDQKLAEIIKQTVNRGGSVLIPAFAVGRSQVIMKSLSNLKKKGAIPDVPVFLDSPMAVEVTGLYLKYPQDHRFSRSEITETFEVAQMIRDVADSKALNSLKYPRIIISASGMATGGRVLHHIANLVGDYRNSVVFTGFQAGGTRGQRMISGEPTVRIFGHEYPIRADIHSIDGYSAHADSNELLRWLRTAQALPKKVILNHGEPGASDLLRQRIERELGINCTVPLLGDQVDIV